MYYSVPSEYIRRQVDVRITRAVIEVFFQGDRICSHPRLTGRDGQYSTLTEHMPPEHQKYVQWSANRFISWAENIGPNTVSVIKAILAAHKVEQQGYRACMALLKSAERYSPEQVEAACQTALSYTPTPNYRSVQTLLKTGNKPASTEKKEKSSSFGFTRGPGYYGGDR